MRYAGFLLRQERLNRNWSQEGLCRGICTVSYLSKIEQGKAEPSPDIIGLLLARMELPWYPLNHQDGCLIENAYEALFSRDDTFRQIMLQAPEERFLYSPYGPDWLLLKRVCARERHPLEDALECCLNDRQLALQRHLQGRHGDAIRLYPCAFFHYWVGADHYHRGEIAQALESLQLAYQLAAQEGRPRVMLYAKMIMGNCYSNQHNLHAMSVHYLVATRLATALGDEAILKSIHYNTAATQLEVGEYTKALSYFETLADPSKLALHKLAICYEKMGKTAEARYALDRAQTALSNDSTPRELEEMMLSIVRFRLDHPHYVQDEIYGNLLLTLFAQCREHLPSGYAVFHLPWVLEWYEAHRQYKLAFTLLRDFPEIAAKATS